MDDILQYMNIYRSLYGNALKGRKGPAAQTMALKLINESIERYKMDVKGGDPTGEAYRRAVALKAIKAEANLKASIICESKKGGKRRTRRHSKKRRTQKRGKTRIRAALNTFVRKGNRLNRDVSTRF